MSPDAERRVSFATDYPLVVGGAPPLSVGGGALGYHALNGHDSLRAAAVRMHYKMPTPSYRSISPRFGNGAALAMAGMPPNSNPALGEEMSRRYPPGRAAGAPVFHDEVKGPASYAKDGWYTDKRGAVWDMGRSSEVIWNMPPP